MTDTQVATMRAAQSLINSERLPTNATTRQARRVLTVTQVDGVSEVGLREGEPKVGNGKSCQHRLRAVALDLVFL